MVDLGLLRSPRSVAEALWTGTIPAELAAILAAHSWTVRKDGTARTPEECTGRGMHFFLSHIALGEVPAPVLERVTLVGVDEDGRVHLMLSLLSVRVDVYSTECHLFACLGELPAEGLPPVMEILPDFFRGMAIRLRCATHQSHCAPGRDLPSRLADDAIRAGCEGGRDRICQIGLPGSGVHPVGLRGLAYWEGG